MCGRYRRTTAEEEIAKQYHVAIPSQLDLPISYNIAPSQNILAIREGTLAGVAKSLFMAPGGVSVRPEF
jgi:putative SOS response-associated peptidase YedK